MKLNSNLKIRFDDFKAQNWPVKNDKKSVNIVSIHIRRLEGFGVEYSHSFAFLRCATQIAEDDNTKFFLATDHIPTRIKFSKLLGSRLIHLNSTFDRETVSGVQNALLEIYLLGEADAMIKSPYSSFSDISYSRTSLVPYKVGRDGQCLKTLSSQPCFYYYFGLFDLKCFNPSMIVSEMTNQEDCFI